jgi:hypothetical protein
MLVERRQIDIAYADDADAYLQKLLELVGTPVIEHEPLQLEQQPKQLEHDAKDGQEYGLVQEVEPETIDIIEELGCRRTMHETGRYGHRQTLPRTDRRAGWATTVASPPQSNALKLRYLCASVGDCPRKSAWLDHDC